MHTFKEPSLTHFNTVKDYIADQGNIHVISERKEVSEQQLEEYINASGLKPNLYALYIKKPAQVEWQLRYIGQRKSDGIKQRLREHLVYCNTGTGSKLDNVKIAREKGYEIGIKLLRIVAHNNTEHIRLAYESMLIEAFRDQLSWNKKQQ